LLTSHQIPHHLLYSRIVISPSVKVAKCSSPFLRVVLGHEGEMVGDVAYFLAEELGNIGGRGLDVNAVSF
jgi:hypothetical protein